MIEANNLTGNIETNELTGALDYRQVGTIGVEDVQVNGTSVVENKVANIDLTGKQDTLVSGTNIKTINNNSILGSEDLNIPNMYFATRSEMMGSDSYLYDTDVTNYNNACLLANKYIPFVIMRTGTTFSFIFYPFVKSSGKLRYTAFGYDGQGRFYKCYTDEIVNPTLGQLTKQNLRMFCTENDVLITGNRFITFNPIYDNDPATKKYVDDNIGNTINARFVTLTQTEYDDLVNSGTIDSNTFYFIIEE